MPAKRRRTRVVRGDPEVEAERRRLFVRSVVFGVLVLVLMTVALSVVVSTLTGDNQVTITVSVSYTVKLMEVPSERSESARALLLQPAIRSLAGENELFLRNLPDGRIALCAGRFASADSPEARALLSRFREYTLNGRRSFPSARIWGYSPDATE